MQRPNSARMPSVVRYPGVRRAVRQALKREDARRAGHHMHRMLAALEAIGDGSSTFFSGYVDGEPRFEAKRRECRVCVHASKWDLRADPRSEFCTECSNGAGFGMFWEARFE